MARSWLSLLLPSSLCLAQVTGTFSVEKSTFAPGEPIFLSLTLRNAGKQAQAIETADPYAFCSGYTIHITRDESPDPACFQGWGGSCPGGAVPLLPGATRTEKLLLNYQNTSKGDLRSAIDRPGSYTVDVARDIAFAPPGPGSRVYTAPDHEEVRHTFHLLVDSAMDLSPAIYTPFVEQLSSPVDDIRRNAARTLATFAPPALEPLLLSFATSRDYAVKQFAPLALTHLATKASLAALAGMLLHGEPGTYEFMMAAEGLGKTHDPAWLPLLLELADQHGSMYLGYAAESGGEAALPALLTRLRISDPNLRGSVIDSLGRTGARAAIPILISLLRLPSTAANEQARDEAIAANVALSSLTHLFAEQGPDGAAIPGWHTRWQTWWLASGSSATIYKPGACATQSQLP